MALSSNETAPSDSPARALPSSNAPSAMVMDALAMIFPSIAQPTPIVAELPTCQKTLAAWAPLTRITAQVGVVRVKVDEDIWKTQTAFVSPWASRVRFPPVI